MSWKPEPRLEITVNHSALPDELDVKFNYVEPTTVVSKIRSAISKVNNLFGYVVAAALTVLALSWMIPLKGFFELSLALAIVFVFVYVMLLLMVFSEEKDGVTSVKFRAKVGEEEVVNTSVLRSTLLRRTKRRFCRCSRMFTGWIRVLTTPESRGVTTWFARRKRVLLMRLVLWWKWRCTI